MSKVREKKARTIDSLEEVLSKCSVGILTDYRGLSAHEMTVLRRRLGEMGIEYRVVKNTLARFAAERLGRSELAAAFEGPVALAVGYGEIVEPAKVLANYINSAKSILSIKGGFLGARLLTSEEVSVLSKLPSWEIMLAKVLGAMQGPIAALVYCLNGPVAGLARVLQARINQLEGE
ncbi:MAG: 50S ribosomal protein L10 [Dehalococcoidales bacterium]|jgi:large subunit ribosomal protein L10|nr:50S ribosomal protein L10 [Dehalococcoidales bacterium]